MKKILFFTLSLVLSISMIFGFSIIVNAATTMFNLNESEAFYRDFELTPEEVAKAVEDFCIDPVNCTMNNALIVQMNYDDYKNYGYKKPYSYNDLAHLFGLADEFYYYDLCSHHMKMGLPSDIYVEEYYIYCDGTDLTGKDFVYFAAKLLYAAGYTGKYASYDGFHSVSVGVNFNVPLVSTYVDEEFNYDIDYDGEFNSRDVRTFKLFLAGYDDLINFNAADQDGDEVITAKDYRLLKSALVG